MTMTTTSIIILCSSYETKVEDNNEPTLSLSFGFFSCIAKDNDKPPHSSSPSTIQGKKKKNIKTHKRTMSLLACHRPLQPKKKNLDVGFSWVVGDDNEPPDLSCLLVFYPHL
jgi:hypothetical protein